MSCAIDLLGRNIHVWLLVIIMVGGIGYLVRGYVLAETALAGFLLLAGTDVAGALDCKTSPRSAELLAMVRKAMPRLAVWVSLYVALPLVVAMVGDVFAGHAPARQLFFDAMEHGETGLNGGGSALARGLGEMGLGIVCVGAFPYLIFNASGLEWWRAIGLSKGGEGLNFTACAVVILSLVIIAPVVAKTFVYVLPLLFCLYSAVLYVAFRDIFLGIGKNRALETSPFFGMQQLQPLTIPD
jgi:hypothetical protein